jgi:hypothetical protein
MGWMTKVQFLAGAIMRFFLFAIVSRPALVSTQPPVQGVLGVKCPWCEADHLPPSCAKVKNV